MPKSKCPLKCGCHPMKLEVDGSSCVSLQGEEIKKVLGGKGEEEI